MKSFNLSFLFRKMRQYARSSLQMMRLLSQIIGQVVALVIALAVLTTPAWAEETVKVVSLQPVDDGLTEAESRSYRMVGNMLAEYNLTQDQVYIEYEVYEDVKEFKAAAVEALAILTCFDDARCQSEIAIAQELNKPIIGVFSGAANLRPSANEWSYPVRLSEQQEIKAMVEAADAMAVEEVVVGVENNAYGKRLLELLNTAEKPAKLKIKAQFTLSEKANIDSQVQKVIAQKPSGIFLLSNNQKHLKSFVDAWEKNNINFSPTLFHTSAMANQEYGKDLTGYFGGSIFVTSVPSPWSGATNAQREHQKVAQDAGIYGLSYRSFEMYIATRVLLEGIISGVRTSEDMMTFLRSTPQFNIGGYKLSYRGDVTNYSDTAVLGRSGAFRH